MEDQNQTGTPADQSGSSESGTPSTPEPSSMSTQPTPPSEPVETPAQSMPTPPSEPMETPAQQMPPPAPQPMAADYIPATAAPTSGYATGPTTETNTLAIISLVASIASWIIIPGLGGIIGVICAIIARNQIKESAGRQSGDGLAIAGLIVGAINIVLICLVLLCFVTGMLGTVFMSGGNR